MFASDEESKGYSKLITELNTSFDKNILKICEKKTDDIIIEEEEIIIMGVILTKVLDLNGIPKKQFLKRLNRTPIYKRKPKEERSIQQLLSVRLDLLEEFTLFSDSCESLRHILFHINSENNIDCQRWMVNNSENLITCVTSPLFSTHSSVQIIESCYTIAIIVFKYPFVFVKHYKKICNYLLMIITEGSSIIQNYVDLRNDKLRETASFSFDQDNEKPFHFPLFGFEDNNCLNKQLSIAYFTLAFCLDCINTPHSILFLLTYAINTKEVSRYYLVWLIRVLILSIDKEKCKIEKEWTTFPWRIHNELIKLYIDRNSRIRNMASDINSHIKQCSPVKLPFITKPVLDTVDIMTKVIEQKKLEPYDPNQITDSDDVNIWKKWLDLDKNIQKISDESESGSTSSKSKTFNISVEEDPRGLVSEMTVGTHSDLFHSVINPENEILPQHTRQSILLPNLGSLVTITKLRTQKFSKNRRKRSK